MALYRQRWGDADAGDAAPPPSDSAVAGGVALGLVPFALVALAFWAVFAPSDSARTSYRGRKH